MTKHRALKFAAVSFSVLLIGGYVYLRAQGERQFSGGEPAATRTRAPVILPGSKSFTIDPSASTTTTRPAFFYGSKSGAVIAPAEAEQVLGGVSESVTTNPAANTP